MCGYKFKGRRGSSVLLSIRDSNKQKVIEDLDLGEDDYIDGENEFEISNLPNLLFLEDKFIKDENLEFEDFLERYSVKKIDELRYFSANNNKTYSLKDLCKEDKRLYRNILDENNINTNGIIEEKMVVPPFLFSNLQKMSIEYEKKEYTCYNYLMELFSLFAIADKTKIIESSNKTIFEFSIFSENSNMQTLCVPWKEWNFFEGKRYFNCYKWITERTKENFRIKTLIRIVRQYLVIVGMENSDANLQNSLDSILNRIILNETTEYFLQQNKLKDEFINYQKLELDSKKKLNNSLLGLITSIGVAYYGKVISGNVKDYNFFEKNRGLAILFVFSFIAVIYFVIIFMFEYGERKKYYDKLKSIYLDKFGFSKDDFESFLSRPRLFKGNLFSWMVLILFLIAIGMLVWIYF